MAGCSSSFGFSNVGIVRNEVISKKNSLFDSVGYRNSLKEASLPLFGGKISFRHVSVSRKKSVVVMRNSQIGGGDGNGNGGNGKPPNGGGGGGNGGGDENEEDELGPLLNYEEAMRETTARGASLPSDMLDAAKSVGIRKLLLLRYLDLQVNTFI